MPNGSTATSAPDQSTGGIDLSGLRVRAVQQAQSELASNMPGTVPAIPEKKRDLLGEVLSENKALAKKYSPDNTHVVFAPPERAAKAGDNILEFWDPKEKGSEDFPRPEGHDGKTVLEFYKPSQNPEVMKDLIYGDLLHGMDNDPKFSSMKRDFINNYTPETKAWLPKLKARGLNDKAIHDMYIRGWLSSDEKNEFHAAQAAGKKRYSPKQLQVLDRMQQYLKTGEDPEDSTSAPNLEGLRVRTIEQARKGLASTIQPDTSAPFKTPDLIPAPVKKAAGKVDTAVSEKVLKPFREGLENMGSDLQEAGETGRTKTGGQLTPVTRALAGAAGTALKAVPVGSNLKETAVMALTPPELGPEGKTLSKEIQAGENVALDLTGLRVRPVKTPAPISTMEGAQPLADKLGAKVVGSVAKKGEGPRDLDLRIDGEYNHSVTTAKMKDAGFEPRGSSLVSPKEAKASGKPYGGPGWKRAEHFENAAGQKIDVWHDEPERASQPSSQSEQPEHQKLYDEALSGLSSKASAKPASKTAVNASGESAASQEAIGRVASEKSKKIQRLRIDTRSGKETPIMPGVDAVDLRPKHPYEKIILRGPTGETVLDRGARAN